MARNTRSFRPTAENLEGRQLLSTIRPPATPWTSISPGVFDFSPTSSPKNFTFTVTKSGNYSINFFAKEGVLGGHEGVALNVPSLLSQTVIPTSTSFNEVTANPMALQVNTKYHLNIAPVGPGGSDVILESLRLIAAPVKPMPWVPTNPYVAKLTGNEVAYVTNYQFTAPGQPTASVATISWEISYATGSNEVFDGISTGQFENSVFTGVSITGNGNGSESFPVPAPNPPGYPVAQNVHVFDDHVVVDYSQQVSLIGRFGTQNLNFVVGVNGPYDPTNSVIYLNGYTVTVS